MTAQTLRTRLGTIGVWSFRFDSLDPFQAADAANEIERLGFPSLWVPEVGRTEAMSLAAHLLGSTSELVIANGIARVSDRSAAAAAAAHRYLDAVSDGRHVLGLGLGAKLSNESGPINAMAAYVDEFDSAWAAHPDGPGSGPTYCLAAYNDGMGALGGDRSAGVHTYLVNDAHTAHMREVIGHGPVIAAEMAVVFTDDPTEARAIARAHLATYIGSVAHQRKFKGMGFTDADFADGGSDALVDALVVHGDAAIVGRIRGHIQAGADHVGVQVLGTSTFEEDVAAWTKLAALTSVGQAA